MTRRIAVLLLTLGSALSAADLTGVWTGQLPGRNNTFTDIAFKFVQSGTAITGKLYGDYNSYAIVEGKAEADRIEFVVVTREQRHAGGQAAEEQRRGHRPESPGIDNGQGDQGHADSEQPRDEPDASPARQVRVRRRSDVALQGFVGLAFAHWLSSPRPRSEPGLNTSGQPGGAPSRSIPARQEFVDARPSSCGRKHLCNRETLVWWNDQVGPAPNRAPAVRSIGA